jgi:hypothetical protein
MNRARDPPGAPIRHQLSVAGDTAAAAPAQDDVITTR